ncbi:MAG: glycosyl transferase, partial [Planctomycetia bacterium]
RRWWDSQGRIEYPALFDSSQSDAEMHRIAAGLTPGFHPQATPPSIGAGIRDRLGRAFLDRAYRGEIASRAIEVLRTEGVTGVYRRLVR